ncbi:MULTISPECIES: VOC family protein [Humibacter]
MTSIWPFLAVKDVDAAVEFYIEAFGAVEQMERVRSDDGAQVAVLMIDGCPVGLATESVELRTPSPETVHGTTVRIHLDVDDPDELAARAVAAGAKRMFAVADQPYGIRQGRVVDPFGHHWLISGPLKS